MLDELNMKRQSISFLLRDAFEEIFIFSDEMGFLRSEPGAASMFAHGNSRVNTDSYIIVTIFAKSSIQANPNQLLTWRFGN
jgi:hypothetical protein